MEKYDPSEPFELYVTCDILVTNSTHYRFTLKPLNMVILIETHYFVVCTKKNQYLHIGNLNDLGRKLKILTIE